MLKLNSLLAMLVLLAMSGLPSAAETPATKPATLDLSDKNVKREEISESLIGRTSTKLFYTVADQHAVVVIHIDNTKKEFPANGKVYVFDKASTAEDLAKWVNNQHSDGLFPDVPEPKAALDIPAEACKTAESKSLGQTATNNTTYDQHAVVVKISNVDVSKQLKIKEFKDMAKVYVLAK